MAGDGKDISGEDFVKRGDESSEAKKSINFSDKLTKSQRHKEKVSEKKIKKKDSKLKKDKKAATPAESNDITEAKAQEISFVDTDKVEEKEDAGVTEWEHILQPPMLKAVCVKYCKTSGLPTSYCKYASADKPCEHRETGSTETVTEALTSQAVCEESAITSDAVSSKAKSKKEAQKLQQKKVTVQKVSRAAKKTTTVVSGMDLFEVKLEEAVKLFKRQFACGCHLMKQQGQLDKVEIQGDVGSSLMELLATHPDFSSIPTASVQILPPK